jgi:enoyl-CoA hydratase/carnithine racemase
MLAVERHDDGLAVVTLNRPEKRNALSLELRERLAAGLQELHDAHAILLTGAGSAFCAGMDVTQFGGDRAHRERIVATSIAAFRALALHPVPTIAYVNGPAVAGGFALALLCDVRLAAETARFGFPELGRHIPPAYAAASAALPEALARELCLTGRLVDAREAVAAGIAARLATREEALAFAHGVAAQPPAATAAVKRRALAAGEHTWRRALELEEEELRAALLSDP